MRRLTLSDLLLILPYVNDHSTLFNLLFLNHSYSSAILETDKNPRLRPVNPIIPVCGTHHGLFIELQLFSHLSSLEIVDFTPQYNVLIPSTITSLSILHTPITKFTLSTIHHTKLRSLHLTNVNLPLDVTNYVNLQHLTVVGDLPSIQLLKRPYSTLNVSVDNFQHTPKDLSFSSLFRANKLVLRVETISRLISLQTIPSIHSRAIIVFPFWFFGIDPRIIISASHSLILDASTFSLPQLVTQPQNLKQILKLYYPTSITPRGTSTAPLDLTHAQSVHLHSTSSTFYIPPLTVTSLIATTPHETLTQLGSLTLIQARVFNFPTTLTNIVLVDVKTNTFKQYLPYLKRLSLHFPSASTIANVSVVANSVPLLTFLSLEKAYVSNITQFGKLQEIRLLAARVDGPLPKNINEIVASAHQLPDKCGVKILSVDVEAKENGLNFSKYYNLVKLNILNLRSEKLRLPTSLTSLHLNRIVHTNFYRLVSATGLKKVVFEDCDNKNVLVALPTSLSTLVLIDCNGITLPNLDLVKLKKLVLIRSAINFDIVDVGLRYLYIDYGDNALIDHKIFTRFPLLNC
ncbi:Leucine-rich repeat containing protein [Entamoeba marina]